MTLRTRHRPTIRLVDRLRCLVFGHTVLPGWVQCLRCFAVVSEGE